MKRSFFYFSIILILCIFVKCTDKSDKQTEIDNTDSIKKIVLGINDRMIAAAQDSVNGPNIFMSYCEDSIIANNDGDFSISPYTVSDDLGNGASEPPHDFTFMHYGKTAILSFLYTSFELINSDTLYHHLRVTKTFVLDQGKWKMACVFDAPQPVNYNNPVVEKNASLYKRFAGVYQCGETMMIDPLKSATFKRKLVWG